MALPTKKIRLVIPDPDTRDEVTHQFDTLDEVVEFIRQQKQAKNNVSKRIEVTEAAE